MSDNPEAQERAAFEAWCRTRPGHPFAGAFTTLMRAAWNARAALAQQAATPAPAGWKLVPIEPTPEMIAAWPNGNHGAGHEASIYRAMLLAAPPATPAAQPQGEQA